MSESTPGEATVRAEAADGDTLAARLLAAHRALAALGPESDARIRLHLRYMAICTSLKMPGANRARGAERLDQLMADAERARAGSKGGSTGRSV